MALLAFETPWSKATELCGLTEYSKPNKAVTETARAETIASPHSCDEGWTCDHELMLVRLYREYLIMESLP